MPSQPNDSTKRRPVDVLFGDKETHSSPNYVVESPQPVTTVSPPSPDEATKATPALAPAPPSSAKPAPTFFQPNGKPQTPLPAPMPVPAPTVASVPAPIVHSAPAFDPEPVIAHPVVAPNQDRYVADISARIEKVYERVKQSTQDSRAVADYCMAWLLKARQAYATQDYPSAEFSLQTVEAKLQRSEASKQASRRPIIWIIVLWQLIALAVSGFAIAISFIANLTLFGLPVLPQGIVLLRAIGWGGVGGAFGALTNFVSSIRQREYESSANSGYFARPMFGGILGAIFFLLSQAGVIAGNVVWEEVQLGPVFLYVFAVLVGFKQEAVLEMFASLVKTILDRK